MLSRLIKKSGKIAGLLCGLCLLLLPQRLPAANAAASHVYLVFYITQHGRTGHVGIAVDNYRVVLRDTWVDGQLRVVYDTLRTGTLTYFDLWGPPEFGYGDYGRNLAARYYRLPRTSAEARITPDYFLEKGLPHSYDYPCDALVRIDTRPGEDYALLARIDSLVAANDFFNPRRYNCTDFVRQCVEAQFGRRIRAREFVPFGWSTTPNKFYRKVTRTLPVEIIKSPGSGVRRSFFRERVLGSVFSKKKSNVHDKQIP